MTHDCLPHQVLAALERSLLEPQGVRAGEVRLIGFDWHGLIRELPPSYHR